MLFKFPPIYSVDLTLLHSNVSRPTSVGILLTYIPGFNKMHASVLDLVTWGLQLTQTSVHRSVFTGVTLPVACEPSTVFRRIKSNNLRNFVPIFLFPLFLIY